MRTIVLICLILVFQLTSSAPASADDGSITGSFTTGDYEPPCAVTNLDASSVNPYSVKLRWTAPGDDGDEGTAAGYDIRYSISPITTEQKWINGNKVLQGIPAPGPAGSNQTAIVSGLLPYTTYYFALKSYDDQDNWSPLSNCASITTPVEYAEVTQDQAVQPTTPVVPTTPVEDLGPTYLDIKGKRAVIFLDLLSDGTLKRALIITINEKQLKITVQKGTIFLDEDGKPINVIVLEYIEPYGTAPSGLAFQATYNFQPYCVIEPPVGIEFLYDLQELQTVEVTDINIASYNQNESRWTILSTTRDTTLQTASTQVAYFSLFSLVLPWTEAMSGSANVTPMPDLIIKNLILSSSVIEPGETVIVNVDVANVGGADGEFYLPLYLDGRTMDVKTVFLTSGQEKAETFTLVLDEEGIHTIGVGSVSTILTVQEEVAAATGGFPPLRTMLIWGSIIGLAVVCLVVLFNLWRKGKTSPRHP